MQNTNEASLASGYERWRKSLLGRVTDAIERREVLRMGSPIAGKHILDVGCGDGFFTIAFAKGGGIVTGVDTDAPMLDTARANAARAAVSIDFIQADARALPYGDASFDLVVAVSLLCLMEDRACALAEMVRVLKPGGRLVVGELGAWSLWSVLRRIRGAMGARPWRDAHFFTPGELHHMLQKAGLKRISVAGAIYYPPVGLLAALMAPLDSLLARLGTVGAAFLIATGDRSLTESAGD